MAAYAYQAMEKSGKTKSGVFNENKPMHCGIQEIKNGQGDISNIIISTSEAGNPLNITSGSQTIIVTEPNHGRANGSTVAFRNIDGSPGGLAYTVYENINGFVISVLSINTYSFTLGSTPNTTEQSGGMTVTAGPVTLTP